MTISLSEISFIAVLLNQYYDISFGLIEKILHDVFIHPAGCYNYAVGLLFPWVLMFSPYKLPHYHMQVNWYKNRKGFKIQHSPFVLSIR